MFIVAVSEAMDGKSAQIWLLRCLLFLPCPLTASRLVPQLAADSHMEHSAGFLGSGQPFQ